MSPARFAAPIWFQNRATCHSIRFVLTRIMTWLNRIATIISLMRHKMKFKILSAMKIQERGDNKSRDLQI
ncbi:hypothetical protein NC651_013685 [Populus alba x Populus x berolinensis]|nr:hypothetical protein NC651_013685 [Populus alba x Populus x berolinensis]